MKELLYKEKGTNSKCFIKITNKVGITFGQTIKYISSSENKTPLGFRPAQEGEPFNTFEIHKIRDEIKLDDDFIKRNNILEFIIEIKLYRDVVETIFTYPNEFVD